MRACSGRRRHVVFTLALTPAQHRSARREYRQTLPLPPGVFGQRLSAPISTGTRCPGASSEEDRALGLYLIRDSERRDPGLLVYTSRTNLNSGSSPSPGPSLPRWKSFPSSRPPRRTEHPSNRGTSRGAFMAGRRASAATRQYPRGGFLSPARSPPDTCGRRAGTLSRSHHRSLGGQWVPPAILPTALHALQKKFPDARNARITLATL